MCNTLSILHVFARWIGVGILLWCAAQSLAWAQDPIQAARSAPRKQAIEILEAAVQRSPERIDYWVELIHRLDPHGLLADCTSRVALQVHPDSPALLLARASLFWPASSQVLELINKLEKIPGHESEAHDARELLSLGMRAPCSWNDFTCSSENYIVWVAGLIVTVRWQRADEVLQRALALYPDDKDLTQCQAMILAERGQFDRAIDAQNTARGRRSDPEPGRLSDTFERYWCLGDLLLLNGNPEWAIKSFGPLDLHELQLKSLRYGKGIRRQLILAEALLLIGEYSRADEVLRHFSRGEGALLRIESLVKNGKSDEAHALGEKLIAAWSDNDAPDKNFDLTRADEWPISLISPLKAAVAWLLEEFPMEQASIESHLGTLDKLFSYRPMSQAELFAQDSISALKRRIATANRRDARYLRNELAWAWAREKEYETAAAIHVENAFTRPSGDATFPHLNRPAVDWAVCNRRAQTVKYLLAHPEMMAQARQTISRLPIWGMDYQPRPTLGWLTPDEVTARLTAMGSGVMALVYDGLHPGALIGEESTPFVRVIENIGGEEDLPVLIDAFATLVKHDDGSVLGTDRDIANCTLSEAALERAIVKLTKRPSPGGSRIERANYWSTWWETNARRIILGKN